MSTVMNNGSGNMSSAALWSLVDATSFNNSETGTTATTTSWSPSNSFTPGAITIDGLAIKLSSHTAVGNFSVRLGQSGTITANTLAVSTVITSATHGLSTGNVITIAGSNSTPSINGSFNVTVLSANTFSIPVTVTVAGTVGSWVTNNATITSNTSAAATVCTSTAHGLSSGQSITISGSTSTPSLNGTYTVTVLTVNTFSIPVNTTAGFASGVSVFSVGGGINGGTTVTVGVNDLTTNNAATNNGWVFVKFPSSQTLTTGATYNVSIQSSTASNIVPYRNTAGDWSRALRTTTTQAPVVGDNILVNGQFTGVGANTSYTVTMDGTATTQWGDLEISDKSTFAFGTAASTAYYFKVANAPTVYTGGTFNMGTAGTPMPSTSSGQLEIVCTSNVQFGLEIRTGATMNTGGAVIVNSALLAADASAGATALTTNVSTSWRSGNVIALASTTQTRAQCESKTLTANAAGTGLTIAALTNAHGGSAGTVAELINLTRNVSIFSTSTTNQTYVNITAGAIVDFESTEFYNMGSASASKRGIDIATSTGTATINNCSIHDFNVASSIGINCNTAANAGITISNTVIYNISSLGLNTVAGTTTTNTFNTIICILSGASCFSFANLMGSISNITAVGGATRGMLVAQQLAIGVIGTINNLIAHSNTGPGVDFTGLTSFSNNPYGYISNITAWRNTTFGFVMNNTFDVIVDTGTIFGNTTAGWSYSGSCGNTFVRNMVVNAGTTLLQPIGCQIANDTKETYVGNCTFGATTTHATGDVQVSAVNIYPRVFFRNCLLNSATPVATPANMIEGGQISSARHQQTAGNHKTWKKFGITTPDISIFNKAAPSERLTPNNAVNKLFSGYKKVAVPNGQTAIINVFVRKSVAGDGSAYNGNQPRLIQKADAATGNNADLVLATATNAANGAFQLLTATIAAVNDDCVVQFYIDCDGTSGWVSVDDWSVNS